MSSLNGLRGGMGTPPLPDCAGKSWVRSLGLVTSERRSPGSFKDWKYLRMISGQVAKAKVLKSGLHTLAEGRWRNKNQ